MRFWMKVSGLSLVLCSCAAVAFATPVPEIDPGNGMNAIALLTGVVLVIRSRKRA